MIEVTHIAQLLTDSDGKLCLENYHLILHHYIVLLHTIHKAVVDVFHELVQLDKLDPLSKPAGLFYSLQGLLHANFLLILENFPLDQVPILKLLLLNILVLTALFHLLSLLLVLKLLYFCQGNP